MRQVFNILLSFLLLFTIYYLLLPAPNFPAPPPGSLRSNEPGDMESTYRRAYFTNYSRSDILKYYSQTFNLKIPFQILQNHPPEEARKRDPGSDKIFLASGTGPPLAGIASY